MTALPAFFRLTPAVPLRRVISGGQTGVDRAALDAAIAAGLEHGGWCPKGRVAEDGVIPPIYQLKELPSSDYAERTRQNVLASDATLILGTSRLTGGSLLTLRSAQEMQRPCLTIKLPGVAWLDPRKEGDGHHAWGESELNAIATWLSQQPIQILNVAGPRASKMPEAYGASLLLLKKLFEALPNTPLLEEGSSKKIPRPAQ